MGWFNHQQVGSLSIPQEISLIESGDLGIQKPFRFIQGAPYMITCGEQVHDSVAPNGLPRRYLATLIL